MINRKIRTRIYLAVEGEGEQSFVKWLQELSEQQNLPVHLDCRLLRGGGYRSMLESAFYYLQHGNQRKAKTAILLVDGDRGQRKDDGWSLAQLKQEAKKKSFVVIVQNPNQEGWLLRLLLQEKNLQLDINNIGRQLRRHWPNYKKSIDTYALSSKLSLNDLLRVAQLDSNLNDLLSIVGLK